MIEKLVEIGFKRIGAWELLDTGLHLRLDQMGDAGPALYAFAVENDVKYLGKTRSSLGQRLHGYLRPGPTQLTNQRIHSELRKALGGGSLVHVLGFSELEQLRFGQFRLSVASGLEDDIIEQLRPEWNGGDNVDRGSDQTTARSQRSAERRPPKPQRLFAPEASTAAAPQRLLPNFPKTIGRAYYENGFFNVPVDFARYFAGHDASISIDCERLPTPVIGRIDRHANGNETPRVMGGRRLRGWFQQNLQVGQQIRVVVNNETHISISREV